MVTKRSPAKLRQPDPVIADALKPQRATAAGVFREAKQAFRRAAELGLITEADGTQRVLAKPGILALPSYLDIRRPAGSSNSFDITKVYTPAQLMHTYAGGKALDMTSRTVRAQAHSRRHTLEVVRWTTSVGFAESKERELGRNPSVFSLHDELSAYVLSDSFGMEVSQAAPEIVQVVDPEKARRTQVGLSLTTESLAQYMRLDLLFCEPVDADALPELPITAENPTRADVQIFPIAIPV